MVHRIHYENVNHDVKDLTIVRVRQQCPPQNQRFYIFYADLAAPMRGKQPR